jgi:S-adenosylmethionine:tRNA ribosyltransferase-isomerase
MNPRTLSIKDYTYSLPEEKIAKYPLAERDASRLLIYKDGNITEDRYAAISHHIPPGSLLIFNNTKVVEARLIFQKLTGGQVEIFCLEPHEQYPDITTAMLQTGKVWWKCLVGGASKWKHGQVLEKEISRGNKSIILRASYIEKRSDHFIIELSWNDEDMGFAEVLHLAGAVPLPPYIKRAAEITDAERYQTVYAQEDGSVAAPTAGLHFTDSIFQSLAKKNIQTDFVTLHVGAGTFKPVKAETMDEHEMHAEFIDVSKATVSNIISNLGNTIIAVGTTSLRTIESLYWMGMKLSMADSAQSVELSQWEVYDMAAQEIDPLIALQSLLNWMDKTGKERLITKTRIIIAPGYKARIVKALVTNFHQPQSTLLLLVAALIGDDWKKVYDHAMGNDFRFLSYGDGSLLWVNSQ